MYLVDVNVLVYAHKKGVERHEEYRDWLQQTISDPAAFAISELVLSEFVRVVTHPRIFDTPSSLAEALDFARVLRERPNCLSLRPGPRHWEIFKRCCRTGNVRGSLVADAYHAALAIETGSTWITTDADFARFPGLNWRHPLEAP